MKPLCIYHGNCADGFGAAWAVWKRFPDWEFYPGVYQDPPPDIAGRDVVMVDFSYKREVLDEMAENARSVLILDHHKTAAEDLAGYPEPHRTTDNAGAPIHAIFDMNRSGAMIAWDFFHAGQNPPLLLEHIQDRDLWKFELNGTREIQAALFSYPYDFEIWDSLMEPLMIPRLLAEGETIERKHHKDIAELLGVVTRFMKIGGEVVPMANLPYTLTSDAGHKLCEDYDPATFAGCYWDTPEGRVFSLRSLENGADVAEIAKKYGGGGHKHASGFRIPLNELAQFES